MNLRLIAAFALLIVASTGWAQSKEWVTLPLGPAQDFVLEASGDRAPRIPLRSADAAAASASLSARLFDVSSKDGHGKAMANQFSAQLVAATDTKDAAIEVTVKKDAKEVLPGPYALSLRIGTDFTDAKNVQALTVTLSVPPPQLAIEPVVVGREIGFLWKADVINKGELRLRENGGKTPSGRARSHGTAGRSSHWPARRRASFDPSRQAGCRPRAGHQRSGLGAWRLPARQDHRKD